jgi:ureidoglycolate hydrolase
MSVKDVALEPIALIGGDDSRFSPFGTCFSLNPAGGRIPVPLGDSGQPTGGSSTLTIIIAPSVRHMKDLRRVERHPFSVQAFLPFGARPTVTIVAPPGEPPQHARQFTAFIVPPGHGITYHVGTWHTGFMGLEGNEAVATFVHRLDDGSDTEFAQLPFNLHVAEQI